MPNDKNGKLIQVGDRVSVPCVVDSITADELYCNVTLVTTEPMPPYTTPNHITLNAKQVEFVESAPESAPAGDAATPGPG